MVGYILALFATVLAQAGPIHPESRCGLIDNQAFMCIEGQCCSQFGYCGTTKDHCDDKCQSKFSTCPSPALPTRPDTLCGIVGGTAFGCATGQCCSQFGYCGTTKDHCNDKCQPNFSTCPQTGALPIHPEARCGVVSGTAFGCLAGQCCSQFGYCGTTKDHCDAKCQPQYSTCPPPALPTRPDTLCGIVGGTAFGCATGQCCSQFGYCGTTKDHCDDKCQPQYSTCPTTVPPTTPPVGGNAAPAVDPRLKATIINSCVVPGTFAITYDDGPTANIPALLSKLNQLGIKATFFVNAKNFANFVDPNSADARLLKSIFDQGHLIGTHTFSHKDLATLSTQDIWDEMRLNDEAIKRIIGQRPTHLRAPFLSTNDKVLEAVGSFGYKVININLDTRDFIHNNKPNEVALQRQEVEGKISRSNSITDSFISLNHDFTSKIVEWTEELVNLAKAKGYRFVTTAECISDRNPYRA
jgi:peptidoglycan/xylan/chitin deacetylase (PgdA/CDA1 family)